MRRETDGSLSAWLSTTLLGLLLGAIDFLSPDFRPILILSALGGGILGWFFPSHRWKLAIWLGLCIPIAIIAGMALRYHPARGHFVFVDARAIVPALLGASIGGWLQGRR
jgi:hypothetical protein